MEDDGGCCCSGGGGGGVVVVVVVVSWRLCVPFVKDEDFKVIGVVVMFGCV